MPMKKGRLQNNHERKIKKNIRALKRDIDAKELVDFFIENEIFDLPDIDEINSYNPNTQENRNNCFFKLLFQCDDAAYSVFLESLRENNQGHLADLIENTNLESEGAASSEPHEWINNIRPEIRQRQLTDKDLSRLAQTLGQDWELIVLDMGISEVEIQQCKMDNSTLVMMIYAALSKWRSRNPRTATLEKFVRTAYDCSQASTVDWNQMKIAAEKMSM